MNSSEHLIATCRCGQLNVTFSAKPVAQLVCHCNDCQAASGLPYTQAAFFLPTASQVHGEVIEQRLTGGSGQSKSYCRCPECDTFLYATVSVLKGMVAVAAEQLKQNNQAFDFEPLCHVWTSEKAAESVIPADVMQFPKAPPVAPNKLAV